MIRVFRYFIAESYLLGNVGLYRYIQVWTFLVPVEICTRGGSKYLDVIGSYHGEFSSHKVKQRNVCARYMQLLWIRIVVVYCHVCQN